MDTTYRIQDEPSPSALSHVVVNPVWPLLASMLAGAWLALPWFALNSFALGSATRRREWVLVAVALPVTFLLLVVKAVLYRQGVVPEGALPYLDVGLTVWKLTVAYLLFTLQQRSFALHEYYGGTVRNGMFVLLAGAFFGRRAVGELLGQGLWALLLLR
jgi:hypothetical protein